MKSQLANNITLSLAVYLLMSLMVPANAQTGNSGSSAELKMADSFYVAKNWTAAKNIYAKILNDTSTNRPAWNRLGFASYNTGDYEGAMKYYKKALQPGTMTALLKASVYSRMARLNAMNKNYAATYTNIDSAINSGYNSYTELDSLNEFSPIRNEEAFHQLRKKAYGLAYPCMVTDLARQFDFWVGNWDVYTTGKVGLQGHSIIQMVSGGCAILEYWNSVGMAYTGRSLSYLDQSTGKWRQKWVGSDGMVKSYVGEYKDGAMRYDFNTVDPGGIKIKGIMIYYNISGNEVRQIKQVSSDEGKTWTTLYDLTYRRAKS